MPRGLLLQLPLQLLDRRLFLPRPRGDQQRGRGCRGVGRGLALLDLAREGREVLRDLPPGRSTLLKKLKMEKEGLASDLEFQRDGWQDQTLYCDKQQTKIEALQNRIKDLERS